MSMKHRRASCTVCESEYSLELEVLKLGPAEPPVPPPNLKVSGPPAQDIFRSYL